MYLHAMFESVAPADRTELVKRSQLKSFKRNDVVVDQGEWTSSAYLVGSGLLRVAVSGTDSAAVTTDFCSKGEAFTPASLMEDRYQADATVYAALPADVYLVPVVALRELCLKYPLVTLAIYEMTRRRLDVLRAQLRRVMTKSSEAVVARILHQLTELAPTSSGGYDKRITQSVIASYAGLSREQVNKTMKALEQRGLLSKDEHGFNVPEAFAATDFGELPIFENLAKAVPSVGEPTFPAELFEDLPITDALRRKTG